MPEPSFPTTPQSRNPSDNTVILKPVIPDNTAISKPVIPAQAGIRTCPHGNLSDKTVAQTPRPRFPLPWE
ncbi:hypothetical protein [Neisseria gonorrhoeae]|uniref:hypothetical protein n=1 Tax=Neisseria gonorrhoeae TaxID=485 RepID=UPI0035CD2C6F